MFVSFKFSTDSFVKRYLLQFMYSNFLNILFKEI